MHPELDPRHQGTQLSMWGLDIGTTNTSLGRGDDASDRPRLIHLPELVRRPQEEAGQETAQEAGHVGAPEVIPSATQLIEVPDVWARLTSVGPLAGRLLWG